MLVMINPAPFFAVLKNCLMRYQTDAPVIAHLAKLAVSHHKQTLGQSRCKNTADSNLNKIAGVPTGNRTPVFTVKG
jgi:hypothetical protein